MKTGFDYSIGFPYRVYLTFVADGLTEKEPGDFGVSIKFIKYNPASMDADDAGDNVIRVGK